MPRPAPGFPPWFGILLSARELAGQAGRPFSAQDLADGASIRPGARSSARQLASAWLGKLVRWGYLDRVGRIQTPGRKPAVTYVVTEKGWNAQPREGQRSRLARLIEAVRAYGQARGGRAEPSAWKALEAVLGEVDLAGDRSGPRRR